MLSIKHVSSRAFSLLCSQFTAIFPPLSFHFKSVSKARMRANDLREQLAKKDHDIAVPTGRMGFGP